MTTHTITRLGHHGDGIAEGPVYAPMTLPGEVVTGTLRDDRLWDVSIVTPAPERVTPPCPHFRRCGGCRLQHAADAFVADWKADVVRAALAAQGLAAPPASVATSPPRSRRRATLAARRTKKGATAGFHGRASGAITEIPECRLLHPGLMPALDAARDLAVAGGSRKGELDVAVTLSREGLDVAVSGGKLADGALRQALAEIAARHDLARLAWSDEVIVTRRPPVQRFGRTMVVPPPGAFLQATIEGEAALLAEVRRIVGDARRIVDLFAGCGTFTLPLAENARVHAAEGDTAMQAAIDRAWRGAEVLRPVTAVARDLFRLPLTADELGGFDAAVIDPPRAGAAAQVAQLALSGIGRVAFVSCNPVTFARDARRLVAAGYGLERIVVVDQFRWSAHVELVADFRRVPA